MRLTPNLQLPTSNAAHVRGFRLQAEDSQEIDKIRAMRNTRVLRLALCATVLACALASHAAAAGAPCDRACLRTTLDAYLNAVIKHDPAGAPLMIGFRQTENAIVVRAGTGLWKSMTGLGAMQRRYLDAVTGQAAYFGIIKEGDAQAIVTVRVKVDDRKISEAEWIVARAGEFGPNGPNGNVFNAESLVASPPPERTVPKALRLSRESLVAITNSYFDGLTTHDGNIIEHQPGCTRVENGTVMTGRAGRNGGPPGDCASGLENFSASIVAARRYPIVDEEAQAVLALAVFLRKPGLTTRRNMFGELFFIDNAKIRLVYAAMFYPPPEQPVPNWPPYDGNFPVPASVVNPPPPK
jgi:hypothetical protein